MHNDRSDLDVPLPQVVDIHILVDAITNLLGVHDCYTAQHSARVADYALAISRDLGRTPEQHHRLHIAAHLHDIGKLSVPSDVINKPGRLSPTEFTRMREHAECGAAILEKVPALRAIVPVVRHHHERYDGRGYPAGLCGDRIPLEARIIGIADAYDAMTSSRPYRTALDHASAQRELVAHSGTQFDPALTTLFLKLLQKGEFRSAREETLEADASCVTVPLS